MGRIQNIRSWAVQSLLFYKSRVALTIIAVALATILATSTRSFQIGYEQSLKHNIDSMGYQILVTGKGCPHEAATLILRGGSIPMYIDEILYQHIASQPEVQDSTRFLMQSIPSPAADAYQLYTGIDDNFLRLKPGVEFQRGEWFTSDEANEAILGFNVAEYRRLSIGDEIEVRGQTGSVRGILDKMGTQDDGTIFLPLSVSQTLFERRDQLTGVGIRLKEMAGAGPLIDRLYDLPSLQVVRMAQVQTMILNVLHGIRSLLTGFSVLCVAIALMGVFNVSLITAKERTAEMGVLRALGCSSNMLFQLVLSEAFLLSASGAALGGVLTVLLRGSIEWVMRSTLPFVPGGTIMAMSPGLLAGSCLAVVALFVLAGVYPAWRSSVVSPLASIRGNAQ